jgi:hypothetical protein
MTYRGYVKNGAIQLDERVALPEGAAVDVTVLKPIGPAVRVQEGASLEERLSAIWADVPASEWTKLPDDLTDHLDHYIYGTPKQ